MTILQQRRACLAVAAILLCTGVRAQELSANARRQIEALLSEKASRTPAQRKMGSNLVLASKVLRGEQIHPDFPKPSYAIPSVRPDARNNVEVDLQADITPSLLGFLQASGATVLDSSADYRSAKVRMPLLAVEKLAERDDVRQIHVVRQPFSRSRKGTTTITPRDRAVLRQRLADRLGKYLGKTPHGGLSTAGMLGSFGDAFFLGGPDLSGDIAHQTDVARMTYGLDGKGVKIGVVSVGAVSIAKEQAAGRLPPVNILAGQAGKGDEGTAILEILYTMAPGASLYFGAAGGGRDTMAVTLQSLADAGCKIIVDDLFYITEGVFQDDVLSQKMNSLSDSGVIMISAGGNDGSLAKGTSGTWEGDFNYSGVKFSFGIAHGFGNSPTDTIKVASPYGAYALQWGQPMGKATADFDLFILNSSLTQVLGASTNIQNGTTDPFELVVDPNQGIPTGSRILVLNYLQSGGTLALHVSTFGGQLSIATNGALFGHSAAPGVITVAAADVTTAAGKAFTGGAANPVEKSSSDGPRRIFFSADGSPITPDNVQFATNGGSVRIKPDITGADNVSTGVTGFDPFPGASAAAPHVAAIAALMLQAQPSLTASQLRAILASTALDIESPGVDNFSGAGIAMAPAAIAAGIAAGNCTYSVNPGAEGYPAAGGSGSIDVITGNGCPWAFDTTAGWILPKNALLHPGGSTLGFQIASNSGPARTGTIAIGTQVVTIEQTAASITNAKAIGAFGHVTSEGTWKFSLDAVNLGTSPATARLNFDDNNGAPLLMPITFPPAVTTGAASVLAPGQPIVTATFDRSIASNAQLIMESTGPDTAPPLIGWGQLISNGAVSGFGIFSNPTFHWDAVVPLEIRNAPKYVLAFDNTGVLATGVAVANVASQAASVSVVIRDDTGAQIGTTTINLAAQGHTSFMLNQQYSVSAGKRGTIEFQTPTGGQIAVLGLRANGPALTTLPVLANVGFTGGSIAHVTYNGGFTSSFYFVNSGTSSAQFTLKFFDEAGSPLVAPLSLPQTAETLTTSALTRTLAPGAMLVVETQAQDALPAALGSAQLTTTGTVGGFEIFRWTTFGQEASVPLETRTPNSFVLLFDDTNGLTTGVALANLFGSAATITARIYEETGAQLQIAPINLPALGHTSFLLPSNYPLAAGKRGMVEFSIPPGAQISAVGLRAKADGTLTTIPVLVK